MKVVFYSVYEELNLGNRLFENPQAEIGDNLLAPFLKLNEFAKLCGISIGTVDKIPIHDADVVVIVDMKIPGTYKLRALLSCGKPLFLIALESPLIRPESHCLEYHSIFKKVFTWNDELIKLDPAKYLKINYAFDLSSSLPEIDFIEKKNFCCLIAGNKKTDHPQELYSERLRAIYWFERNHPSEFDLFGTGWNEVALGDSIWINFFLRRSAVLRKMFASKRPSYKGQLDRKRPVLEKYKFSICYENALDISGYITEKIFDSFFANCVPIYLGANNIETYVPKSCFIDRRDFANYRDLYNYLKSIKEPEYNNYLENIRSFLNSPSAQSFSCESFATSIVEQLKLFQIKTSFTD